MMMIIQSMREYIHKSIMNICIKENVSPEQVFSVLFSLFLLLSLSDFMTCCVLLSQAKN